MATHRNDADRRLARLERLDLEDRARWQKNEERWQKNEERFKILAKGILQGQRENAKKMAAIERQGQKLDATFRLLHRHLEQ